MTLPVERPAVRWTHGDHVAVITISRPRVRNAIDHATAQLLADALDEVDTHPDARVAVLASTGDVFCAGADLRSMAAGGDRPVLGERGFAGMTRSRHVTPVVAAVQGPALGGGFELVLACDLVVASDRATFGLPEVQRGRLAAGDGLVRLARRLPPAVANELVFTGREMPAEEALRWGLVTAVVPHDALEQEAHALALEIASSAPRAVRASRQVLEESRWSGSLETARATSDRLADDVLATRDAAEGVQAFVEKRPPRWSDA